MMEIHELLAEQARCANRLYDEVYLDIYLAIQKEVNRRAELSTLDISAFELSPATFIKEQKG